MILNVKRRDKTLPLPQYNSAGAAGIDLYLAEDVTGIDWVRKNHSLLVDTGVSVEIPEGYVGLIRSRSSISSKSQVDVAAGVIDSDYRGPLKVLLRDFGLNAPTLKKGIRVAQMLILPCPQPDIIEVDELSDTVRGSGGFGSTDKKEKELRDLGFLGGD